MIVFGYVWVIYGLQTQSTEAMMSYLRDNFRDVTSHAFSFQVSTATDKASIESSTFPNDDTHFSTFSTIAKGTKKKLDFSHFKTTGSFVHLKGNCSNGDMRICDCSLTCLALNNCCSDSPFVGLNVTTSGNSECVETITRNLSLESPAFLMTKCPVDWRNDLIRAKCEHPSYGTIFKDIPCYSPTTGLSYLNQFCAQCHNVSQCETWQLTFKSNVPVTPYSAINTIEKMILLSDFRPLSRRHQFVVSPGRGQPFAHCVRSLIDSCVPQFTSDSSSRYCHRYYNPVKIGMSFYRNIDCFACSTGITSGAAIVEGYTKYHLSPISVLIDLYGGKTNKIKGASVDIEPVIKTIRGYFEKVVTYAKLSSKEDILTVNRTTLEEIYTLVSVYLATTVKWNLRSLNNTVKLQYNIHQSLLTFNILVSITSDIAVERIPEISLLIRNVEHDFQSGEYYITCCFDKNGTRWQTSLSTKVGNASFKTENLEEDTLNATTSQSLKNQPSALICLVLIISVMYATVHKFAFI